MKKVFLSTNVALPSFCHAQWAKSKPTFVQTFNEVWQYIKKFFNHIFGFYEISYYFVSFTTIFFALHKFSRHQLSTNDKVAIIILKGTNICRKFKISL